YRPRDADRDDAVPGPLRLRDRRIPQDVPARGARRGRPDAGQWRRHFRLRDAPFGRTAVAGARNRACRLTGAAAIDERTGEGAVAMTDFRDRQRGEEAKYAMDEET